MASQIHTPVMKWQMNRSTKVTAMPTATAGRPLPMVLSNMPLRPMTV